jgi:hypothetical protein
MIKNNLWAISCDHSALGLQIGFTRYNRGQKFYRNVSRASRRRFERHLERGDDLEITLSHNGLSISSYL